MYDDTFMNELEKILTCFKAISHCFGFDVPEYNCMFMQYDKNIMALVSERMKAVRVLMTPSMFGAMANTLTKFSCAITEI